MFLAATKQVDSNKLNAFRISTPPNQCSSYEGTMLTENIEETCDWLVQMHEITRNNTTWTEFIPKLADRQTSIQRQRGTLGTMKTPTKLPKFSTDAESLKINNND
uniref:Uncharacterized protein n=1 Tax=Panagrellus redivivus TaxID=6233 RepID=A0A7E4VM00_PANRE